MNVLLDLDGTLTDSRQGIVACMGHALQSLRLPVPADDVLATYIGPPLHDTFAELLGQQADHDGVTAAIAAYRERFTAVGMFENAVYDGIPDALESLSKRGARLFLATSKPRVFAEQILDHFDLARYFTAVYGSELDGRLSDKTDLIRHVLVTSGLTASDSLMVGDRRHDVAGALRNGVTPIGVLWGFGSEAELTAAGAARLLRAPAEIADLCTGGNA